MNQRFAGMQLGLWVLPGLLACGQRPDSEIAAVLEAQASAWNRGDVQAFMELGYVRGPELSFSSGGQVQHGYRATLERYQKRYDSPKEMGVLAFSDLEVTPLGGQHALVLGRWALTRAAPVGGVFSLVFRKGPNGWRILHDHTSVTPEPGTEEPATEAVGAPEAATPSE